MSRFRLQGNADECSGRSSQYLMLFKCNIIQEISLIQQGISESQVLTVRKEELGMEEGDLLLSKRKKLLINTE